MILEQCLKSCVMLTQSINAKQTESTEDIVSKHSRQAQLENFLFYLCISYKILKASTLKKNDGPINSSFSGTLLR